MTRSRRNAGKPQSAEELAAEFGPETYRRWIRSEVTNSLLLKILGGLSILVLVATWFVNSNQGLFLGQTVENIKEELNTRISSAVNDIIAERVGLVKAAEEDLKKKIDTYYKSEEFTEKLGAIIAGSFAESFVEKKIIEKIAEQGRERALHGSQAAVRAQGLELYASFLEADEPEAEISIRAQFKEDLLSILSDPTATSSLRATALSYYNFDALKNATCSIELSNCLDIDIRVALLAAERLHSLGSQRVPQSNREYWAYVDLLAKIPTSLLDHVVEELISLNIEGTKAIISTWSENKRLDLLIGSVSYISGLSSPYFPFDAAFC